MKKQHILTFAASVFLLGSNLGQLSAQEAAPETPAPAAPKSEEKAAAKPADPDKVKWNSIKKQAMEDPKVKAANDAAAEAKRQANLKMYEKMRELDPTMSPKIDQEVAKLKPKEPKPDPKAAGTKADSAKPATDKAAGDKVPKDKTVKEKAAKEKTPSTPAKDKTTPATKPPTS